MAAGSRLSAFSARKAVCPAGASGSPVFIFEKGFRVAGNISVTGGKFHRRWSLIGVNAGHMSSHKFGHSQVSYAFKATVIREIIDSL
jgi:hypothetical protein